MPYRFVLMAAMANAIGNKSLFYSKYESFKKVKKSEMKCIGKILIGIAKKAHNKSADQEKYLNKAYDRTANPLWQYLNMLLALKTWKRYMVMYDSIEKDEVDIDSTDFKLQELDEEMERIANTNQKYMKQKQAQEKKKSRRGSQTSHVSNSGFRRGSRQDSMLPRKMPGSRDQTKKPTVIGGNLDFANIDKLHMMEEKMDEMDMKEIAKRQATIEQQLNEEKMQRRPSHVLE